MQSLNLSPAQMKERIRIRSNKWYHNNLEKVREAARRYYWKNREKIRAVQNSSKGRAWSRKGKKKHNDKIRQLVFDHYGRACKCCGESHIEFLSIDHKKGGGNQHRKKIRGQGSTFYEWLVKNHYPKNFQTLCMNCNHAKGRRNGNGHCPHERERKKETQNA